MKKALLSLLFLFCVMVTGVFSDSPGRLDLELYGGLGNLAYNRNRTSALSDESDPHAFGPNYFPLILARISGEFSGIGFDAGFERDPVVRNIIFTNLKIVRDYFSFEAGPFISIFDTWKLPISPGISAGLGLAVPGKVFANIKGSSTLGVPMDITDNFSLNTGDISVGFWVPHVICSFNLRFLNYTKREQSNLLVEDGLNRYFFRFDVFAKNVPYTIRLDLGYQNLIRSYSSQKVSGVDIVKDTGKDEFKSIFLGLEGSYTFNETLKFVLGGEIPVYSWGVRPMKDPAKGTVLFKARTGVVWTLPVKNDQESAR